MSRAFVNDDAADSSADEAPEIRIPIPPGSRNYMTPEGAAMLADELARLETAERPKIAADIDRAGKSGTDADTLSSLRKSLARVDRRIEYLSRMAALADTIEPPMAGYAKVSFGARVAVIEPDGTGRTWRIVGIDEADPERGLVGWTSPLAKALMGKEAGSMVVVKLPDGTMELRIVSVG